MNSFTITKSVRQASIIILFLSCSGQRDQLQFEKEIESLDLNRGDITLCGSGIDQFGTVDFSLSCSEEIRTDFNIATALLHSFEYTEAEKVFAKIIDEDPQCVWAYWGAAMCNFHPMWAPPSQADLQKGARIIELGRSIVKNKSSRESDYLEAIATIYDQWEDLDHKSRLAKFEKACANIFEKYPDDNEAAIFYSLALVASADPSDKSFSNQKKAGEILNQLFAQQPNHPGIAHYIIHAFDYPELAKLALPTARKYAEIAPASAHAQHMPSHIFTRLGLWDESIMSNLNSVSSAKCYAESLEMTGHWDEELHGLDYLIYAYLQQANDKKALDQIEYLKTINKVFPVNFKIAYAFAAMPTRYALERKDWEKAAQLQLALKDFPWEKYPWEKANIHFGRLLGAVHTRQLNEARTELEKLQSIHAGLTQANEIYKSNLVLIQIKAGEGWIKLAEGQNTQAIKLMSEAADMEDATAKHPVTPGAIIPARELLGDMYLETGDFTNALVAYEADLEQHPNRFNGLYGALLALEKLSENEKARQYYKQLLASTNSSASDRPQMSTLESLISPRLMN